MVKNLFKMFLAPCRWALLGIEAVGKAFLLVTY